MGDDVIETGSGNDEINAGGGQDIIDAGSGNNIIHLTSEDLPETEDIDEDRDIVRSGVGDDLYNIGRYNGKDELYDAGGQDVIRLNAAKAEEIILSKYGDDLIIKYRSGEGRVTIKNHF